jgi:hypothetical protein
MNPSVGQSTFEFPPLRCYNKRSGLYSRREICSMFQSQNLSQKILLALSGIGFLAVAGWYIMESSPFTGESSSRTNQLPLNKDLDSLPPELPQTPLKTQSPGALKLPSSTLGLPKGQTSKTKTSGISSSPDFNFNLPTTSLVPAAPLNIPTTNFSSPNTSPPPAQPRARSIAPSFSQPSVPKKTDPIPNNDGPGSILPNLPDPLDRGEPSPAKSSPSVKPSPVISETTSGSPPVSSYAPASDSLQLSPSEFSEPVPLTPSIEESKPAEPPATNDPATSTPQPQQPQ